MERWGIVQYLYCFKTNIIVKELIKLILKDFMLAKDQCFIKGILSLKYPWFYEEQYSAYFSMFILDVFFL